MMQAASGKFLYQKKKQAPMQNNQLVLRGGPSPSDTFIDVGPTLNHLFAAQQKLLLLL